MNDDIKLLGIGKIHQRGKINIPKSVKTHLDLGDTDYVAFHAATDDIVFISKVTLEIVDVYKELGMLKK